MNYQVVTNEEESRRFKPDQIWFTTPSQAYYSEWFREFLQNVPSERVVCFAPEGLRTEFLPDDAKDRFVFGGTTFMAWQGNLENNDRHPKGVNFWLPPLGIPLVGTEKACKEVEQLLTRAGFRVSVGKQDSHMQASATAVMTAFMAGLELSGWSLRSFRNSPWLKRAAGASREAVLSQIPSISSFSRALIGIPVLLTGFFLATLFLRLPFPFDLEKYLKFHYLKTRDQTLLLLDVFEKDGEKREFPVGNIQILLQGLRDSS